MRPIPRSTIVVLKNLEPSVLSEFSSCGRISKKVTYTNVPAAMHCNTPTTRAGASCRGRAPKLPKGDMIEKTVIAENSPQAFKVVVETRLVARLTAMTLLCTTMAPGRLFELGSETDRPLQRAKSVASPARRSSIFCVPVLRIGTRCVPKIFDRFP